MESRDWIEVAGLMQVSGSSWLSPPMMTIIREWVALDRLLKEYIDGKIQSVSRDVNDPE